MSDLATEAISNLVGTSFSGLQPAPAPQVGPMVDFGEAVPFEFDADFQDKIVYLAAHDQQFMRRAGHLLRPDYFESAANAAFVAVVMHHWKAYSSVMQDVPTMAVVIKDALRQKVVRDEQVDDIKSVVKRITATRLALQRGEGHALNGDFVADKVAEFARNQAVAAAILRSADMLNKRDFAKIEKLIADAIAVGKDDEEDGGDYFANLDARTQERADRQAGLLPPKGITTGHLTLDNLLYHRGWGRKELAVLMGGAKAGKTMALIEFATAAVLAGKNVLYVTLEVARTIIEERVDARYSEVPMKELVGQLGEVNRKVEELRQRERIGKLWISEHPAGSFTPAKLRALLERHKARGWFYDLVVVDYADLMTPDWRTTDPIENSKNVYVGIRAIAQEWNIAMLTATQSNREGFKAVVAKAEHVSDDFNKVRIADLFLTLNSTEEERGRNEGRIFFAASRNQESGMSVVIETDFNRARFLKAIKRVE